MLSNEDNEILTRVGRGTLVGNLLRRFWMPALLSAELGGPDCPPVRVRPLRRGPDPNSRHRWQSGSLRTHVRTVAHPCSLVAAKKQACAASITAGSSTNRRMCRHAQRAAESNFKASPTPRRQLSVRLELTTPGQPTAVTLTTTEPQVVARQK